MASLKELEEKVLMNTIGTKEETDSDLLRVYSSKQKEKSVLSPEKYILQEFEKKSHASRSRFKVILDHLLGSKLTITENLKLFLFYKLLFLFLTRYA